MNMEANKVKERPMIFTGESVNAIMAGTKIMTRRIATKCNIHHAMKSAPVKWAGAVYPARESGWVAWYPGRGSNLAEFTKKQYVKGFLCPYGVVGDRIWVKETWAQVGPDPRQNLSGYIRYKADEQKAVGVYGAQKWKNAMFMPRWASRLTLEIIGIRVERLQEITEEDARAEGILEPAPVHGKWCDPAKGRQGHWSYRKPFADKWDEINSKRATWESNPWVWVIEFKSVEGEKNEHIKTGIGQTRNDPPRKS